MRCFPTSNPDPGPHPSQVGEKRIVKYAPAGLHFADEIPLENFAEGCLGSRRAAAPHRAAPLGCARHSRLLSRPAAPPCRTASAPLPLRLSLCTSPSAPRAPSCRPSHSPAAAVENFPEGCSADSSREELRDALAAYAQKTVATNYQALEAELL